MTPIKIRSKTVYLFLFVLLAAVSTILASIAVSKNASAYTANLPSYSINATTCGLLKGTLSSVQETSGARNICTAGPGTAATTWEKDIGSQITSLLYYRSLAACLYYGPAPLFNAFQNSTSAYWYLSRGDASSGAWFDKEYASGTNLAYLGPYARQPGGSYNSKIDCSSMGSLVTSAKSLWAIQYDSWFCSAGWVTAGVITGSADKTTAVSGTPGKIKEASEKCTNEVISTSSVNQAFVYPYYYGGDVPYSNGVSLTIPRSTTATPSPDVAKLADHKATVARSMMEVIKTRVYGGTEPEFTKAMEYYFYRQTFFNSCAYGQSWETGGTKTAPASPTDRDIQIRNIVKSGTTISDPGPDEANWLWFKYSDNYDSGGTKENGAIITRLGPSAPYDPVKRTCQEMLDEINDPTNAAAYLTYIKTEGASQDSGDALLAGTPPATSCAVDGIGWIVCGIMTAMASFNDAMYGAVEGLLLTGPLKTTDASGSLTGQYQIWQVIRDISNVLLVVVFLIIIFSQATSIGISSYGIKKMLPRLIIAAIAINLSFFAMQLAVDLANLAGTGLHDLGTSIANRAYGAANINWTSTINSLLAGAAAATGAIAILSLTSLSGPALGLIALPFMAVAVLAVLAAFITLFVRNVLIILLVMVAPLAFAAYLLPNTESLFTKWRKMLISLLMLFPTAALLFSGAKIAGFSIIGIDPANPLNVFFGYIVLVLPLFMLPWLARQGGGILSSVGGALQGLAKQAKKPLQDVLKPAVDRERNARDVGRAGFFTGRRRQLDADGYALNRDGTRRRQTNRQRIVNQRKDVEQVAKNDADRKERNWEQRAIDNPNGRTGAAITDKEQLHLRTNAQAEALKVHEAHRIADPTSRDKLYTNRVADAKSEMKPLQEQERRDQSMRIRRNEASTLGGGNLGDLSKQGYTAEKRADAAEKIVGVRNRQNNGAADAAMQSIKLSEAQDKRIDAGQQAVYDTNKATVGTAEQIAEQGTVFSVNDSARANAQSKAQVDQAADADPGQMANRDAQKAAEKTSEEITEKQRSEQEARLAPGGDLAGTQANIEGYKTDTEVSTTAQQAEVNRRKNIGGDLFGRSVETETNKKVADERAAGLKSLIDRGATQSTDRELNFLGARNRARLQRSADKKGSYDAASEGANSLTSARAAAAKVDDPDVVVPGMSANVRERFQSGAREAAIGNVVSSKAKGAEDLTRQQEITENPEGDLARAMAAVTDFGPEGVAGGISKNTGQVVGAANQALLKDQQGDEAVAREGFRNLDMGIKEKLRVLGVDRQNDGSMARITETITDANGNQVRVFDGAGEPIRAPDTTDRVAAARDIASVKDIGANEVLYDTVYEESQAAEAELVNARASGDATRIAAAEKASKDTRRLVTAVIEEWEKNPASLPPWISSEDRDEMKRGVVGRSKKELIIRVGGKGKFKAASGDRWDKDNYITMARELAGMSDTEVTDALTRMGGDINERKQNFADIRKTIDALEDDPAYAGNREKDDLLAFEKIRDQLDRLVPDPTYVRPTYSGPGMKNP